MAQQDGKKQTKKKVVEKKSTVKTSEKKKSTVTKKVDNKKTSNKSSNKKNDKVVKKTTVQNKKPVKDLTINEPSVKKDNYSNSFSIREVIVIVVITCLITSLCTGCVMYFKYRKINSISYHHLNDDAKLNEFVDVYSEILDNFYEEVDKEKILNAAINAMVSNLGDDYTSFLTEEEAAQLNQTLAGEYVGIGIQITDNVIVSVFKDSPAEKAGLQVNDVIIKLNGEEVNPEDAAAITNVIKTGDNDTVNIVVKREDEELSFDVTREKLDLPAISYNKIEENGKKIGYIYIGSFSNTLTKQVKNALTELEEDGIDGIIIDVRQNSGGYLNAATGVASLFIENGKVLYSLETKNETKKYNDETDEKREYPMVVLIDGATASSSEILAAALKDSYGATIVGTTSFGKGKVQTKKDLSGGSIVKYTNSKWLRPNGECIDKVGIVPDYEIEIKIVDDKVTDTQMEKAIELLTK